MQNELACKRLSLFYAIACLTCKIQYVGQTNRTILEYFQEYYANTNQALRNPEHASVYTSNGHINQTEGDIIGLHIAQTTPKGIRNLKIQVLTFNSLQQKTVRNFYSKQRFWIHRLRYSAPQGLNIME